MNITTATTTEVILALTLTRCMQYRQSKLRRVLSLETPSNISESISNKGAKQDKKDITDDSFFGVTTT